MSLQQRGRLCLGPAFPTSSPYPEGCCLLHPSSRKMHSPGLDQALQGCFLTRIQTTTRTQKRAASRPEPPVSKPHFPSHSNPQKRKWQNPVSRQGLSSRCSSHRGLAAQRGHLGDRRGRRGVPGTDRPAPGPRPGGMWGMRMACLSGQLQSRAKGWLSCHLL